MDQPLNALALITSWTRNKTLGRSHHITPLLDPAAVAAAAAAAPQQQPRAAEGAAAAVSEQHPASLPQRQELDQQKQRHVIRAGSEGSGSASASRGGSSSGSNSGREGSSSSEGSSGREGSSSREGSSREGSGSEGARGAEGHRAAHRVPASKFLRAVYDLKVGGPPRAPIWVWAAGVDEVQLLVELGRDLVGGLEDLRGGGQVRVWVR